MQSLDCPDAVAIATQPPESECDQECSIQDPETLGELFRRYHQQLLEHERKGELPFFRSTVARYLVPALAGPCPAGAKMKQAEVEAAFDFLDQRPASQLEDLLEPLKAYLDTQETLAPKTKELARGAVRKWMKWAVQSGFIQAKQPLPQPMYRFREARKTEPYRLLDGPRGRLTRNALGIFASDYIPSVDGQVPADAWKSWRANVLLNHRAKLPVYLANPSLDAEIRQFIHFLKHRMHIRTVTAEKDVNTLLRCLGWLHRQQGMPLEDLRITSVIPLIKVKFKAREFRDSSGALDRNALREAKLAAQEDLEAVTDDVRHQIGEFLATATLSPAAAVTYLTGFINLAKYVYQHETEFFRATKSGFTDIFLVQSLRALRLEYDLKLKSNPKTVIPRSSRLASWTEILGVVEKLRVEAELTHRFRLRPERPLQSGEPTIDKVKRSDRAIAVSFQKFLILAIMTATPPGRPRDYRELELGRTLVQGAYQNGVFVFKDDLNDPTQAGWWIHLMPEDYRTGKCYGEWLGELPDIQFTSGKTLYQYMDEWLTRWRPIFQPNHQRLFTQHDGKVLSANNFANKVQTMLFRFTGIRVNPHSLRHAYVTYLKANGATEAEMEGTAAFMRHSRKTQGKIYNQIDLQDKLAPGKELAQKIAESFYSNYEVTQQSNFSQSLDDGKIDGQRVENEQAKQPGESSNDPMDQDVATKQNLCSKDQMVAELAA